MKPSATIPRYDPVEVIDGAAPSRLHSVAMAIAVAALVMLLLGAAPLLDWTNALPIGWASDHLLGVAVWWSDCAASLGLDRIFAVTQDWFRQFQALGF